MIVSVRSILCETFTGVGRDAYKNKTQIERSKCNCMSTEVFAHFFSRNIDLTSNITFRTEQNVGKAESWRLKPVTKIECRKISLLIRGVTVLVSQTELLASKPSHRHRSSFDYLEAA